MIRTLIAPTLAAALGLLAAACNPTSEKASGVTGGGTAAPRGDRMPATYDWHVLIHGGSADLDFGDGDWVEGVSLFHLSCLPGSGQVEMSWGYPENAVLTSRTATGTFEADARAGTDHPVFAALRDSGSIAVGLSGADMTLTAKAAGREEIAAFFDYCETGRQPVQPAETPAAAAQANAAEIAAQAETPVVEEPVEPVEAQAAEVAEAVPAT